jgi:hypothetical protein
MRILALLASAMRLLRGQRRGPLPGRRVADPARVEARALDRARFGLPL